MQWFPCGEEISGAAGEAANPGNHGPDDGGGGAAGEAAAPCGEEFWGAAGEAAYPGPHGEAAVGSRWRTRGGE